MMKNKSMIKKTVLGAIVAMSCTQALLLIIPMATSVKMILTGCR